MNEEQDHLLEMAEERLASARLLYDNDYLQDAVSRAYYSMFHSAKALLLAKDSAPRTHAGTASELGKLYRDELGNETTREFSRIQEKRERADYGELEDLTREETEEVIETVEAFLERTRDLLDE